MVCALTGYLESNQDQADLTDCGLASRGGTTPVSQRSLVRNTEARLTACKSLETVNGNCETGGHLLTVQAKVCCAVVWSGVILKIF